MTLPVLVFPKELLSDNIFVTDDASVFVHYHGIMCSARDNNFENNYGNFEVIYYESVNSLFMLYKFYLEVLCRVSFNNVLKKVLTIILKDFDLNTFSSCRKRSFCSKDSSCSGKKRKEIISRIVKETCYLCLHVLNINGKIIDISFIRHIFDNYRKGVHFNSPNLDIENHINS